jgi:hypothetical protein
VESRTVGVGLAIVMMIGGLALLVLWDRWVKRHWS